MLLKNKYIIDSLNKAIRIHNEKGNIPISEIDENTKEFSEDDLIKLKELSVYLKDIDKKELNSNLYELSQLLRKMNLDSFSITISEKTNNEPIIISDEAFINSLNTDIKQIYINGIDFSKQTSEIFSRFDNLEALSVRNANISDIAFFSKIKLNIMLDICDNPINLSNPKVIVEEIKKRNGMIDFNFSKNNEIYVKIAESLATGKMDLTDMYIPFEQIQEIVEILNKLEGIQFIGNEFVINKLNSGKMKLNFKENLSIVNHLIATSTSEIDLEDLINAKSINSISIIDEEYNSTCEQREPYTRNEFIKIKKEIQKIKEQVNIPDKNDPDREKKIFMQVYRILGKKIYYDFYAISDEGKKYENLQKTSRNLLGGLVENKSVCAGYAYILKNVLSEFGIKAKCRFAKILDIQEYVKYIFKQWGYDLNYSEIEKILKERNTDWISFIEAINYFDLAGHVWNSVILDGENYLCDLTLDADDIKCDNYPLKYCCTSLKEFGHNVFKEINVYEEENFSDISPENQLKFMGYSKVEVEKKLHPSDVNESIKSLESCVNSISSEIKTSDFDEIEKSFTNEKEVINNERTN